MIALLSFGSNWFTLLNQAREHYISGNYSNAWELYNLISKPQIENLIATEKAQTAFRSEKYNQAIQLYRTALNYAENKQVESIIYYNLAICYTQINNEEAAIESYKESIRRNPTKAAKHNLLLLKNKINKAEPTDKKVESQTQVNLDEVPTIDLDVPGYMDENPTSLHERKVEKQLDELERLDAMTKKKAFRKIATKPSSRTQKDW